MLTVRGLSAFYGRAQVLFGVALEVRGGEVAALLGRNGAGKSTTLKAIMGLLSAARGEVLLDGRPIGGLPPHVIARLGIGYVPEDRRVFSELTVLENLEVGRRPPRHAVPEWTPAALFKLFPNLAGIGHRRAGHISGGEQQMLAIARTLIGNPRLLLLDEPSEGLAPKIVADMAATVQRLRREGLAVLLSEQNYRFATMVADRAYVIEKGHIRFSGAMARLAADEEVRSSYLAV